MDHQVILPFKKVRGKSVLWAFICQPEYLIWLMNLKTSNKKFGWMKADKFSYIFAQIQWVIDTLESLQPILCPHCGQGHANTVLLRETSERGWYLLDDTHTHCCSSAGCTGWKPGLTSFHLDWRSAATMKGPQNILKAWLRAHGFQGKLTPKNLMKFLENPPTPVSLDPLTKQLQWNWAV